MRDVIVSGLIVVVGVAILTAWYRYNSPYNQCLRSCLSQGLSPDQAAKACKQAKNPS